MVREDYQLKKSDLPTAATPAVPILGAEGDQHTLSGFRKLKRAHEIEWDLFFFDPEGPHADTANFSMRLDPSLASPLFSLPPDNVSLASLNLHRGRALGLPAGSDVADLLGIAPLTPDELTPTEVLPGIDALAGLESVLAAPPLWYYILCEALARGVDPHPPAGSGTAHPPAKGVRLGDVGGRIVAEVLVGLLERDPRSYVHQVAWKPHLGKRGEFTMVDLVEYAQADPGS
jgi:hypothetical protein